MDYILLGVGLGAVGAAHDQPALALLGLTGAVLHSLNHALFKSLLFLGAGAVIRVQAGPLADRAAAMRACAAAGNGCIPVVP